jgi:putative heme-binding domain-containing protein
MNRFPSRVLRAAAIVVGLAAAEAFPPASATAQNLAETLLAEPRERLLSDVASSGDARRGALVFHAAHLACVKCHVAGTGQAPLGPNLAKMPEGVAGAALRSHLVESLLEPSKVVRPEYRGVTVVDQDGRSATGLVVRETAAELVLRDAASPGTEIVIDKITIDDRSDLAVSLMPAGLANLLTGRGQFLDLVSYLEAVAKGGADAAAALEPDPALLARSAPPAYEQEIDHAGFVAEWSDTEAARGALERGAAIYGRVCANCHGTLESPGSLPTAPRFASHTFKRGADPLSLYSTLTVGAGLMVPQGWMVPSQKYDVIHYLRETFLKGHNDKAFVAITPDYLAALPKGTSRGPAPSATDPWRLHDYGPFLAATIEVGRDHGGIVRKGFTVRLDPGGEGIGRGRAFAIHDLDTLSLTGMWTGDGFIDWEGINFDGRHGAHPHTVGDVQWFQSEGPGWADPATGSFDDPRGLGRDGRPFGPIPWARMRSVHHAGDTIVLDYRVGDAPILETVRLEPVSVPGGDGSVRPVVTRSFSFGPRSTPLTARLAPDTVAAALVTPVNGRGPIGRVRLVIRDGFQVLEIPAGDAALDLAVALSAAPAGALATAVDAIPPIAPAFTGIGQPSRPLWPQVLETRVERGDNDDPLAVDRLAPPNQNPWNAQLRLSGLDFLGRDGDTAAVCTWDGDVWRVSGLLDPEGILKWKRLASGLFQPLGLKVIGGAIHVGCRDRIVRLVDLDDDGQIDRYDTVNDDHQVTEHFHEFAMGLETDATGNLYYAKSARHALPAVVPHHGTLLKVSPDGTTTEIVARGFRAANGVGVEPDGTFWVTDQEGHWNPKNRINHVRPGGFYGNMFGYHDITDARDEAMEPPAIWITNAFDRSPAELLRVPAGTWSPLSGHLLELSYGEGRVHLVLTEPVADPRDPAKRVLQGGMLALPIPDLPTGVMRGRFNPGDGQLYACGLFAWAGNRTEPGGLFRLRRTQKPLVVPTGLHAEPGKLVLTFPQKLSRETATAPGNFQVTTWTIRRSADYGSPHFDERDREVTAATLSADGTMLTLDIKGFESTRCYSLSWDVDAEDGSDVNGTINGTVQ